MDKSEILALRRAVLEKDFARMNDRQKQAVFTVNGPLLILAGAGSGKTTVLINRIANILRYGDAYNSTYLHDDLDENDIAACKAYIENGTPLTTETQEHLSVSACAPWRIMAITFTNKAAGELKDRLCAMLGETANDIWASTFHSTCARILRRDGERIGYSSHFTVYDTDDQRRLMKNILKELDISEKNITPKSILNEISRAKDSLISPAEYALTVGDDFRLKIISRAYTTYQKRLEDADAMDFDDLINKIVELFKKCPDVLEYYQNRFRYLMVDEYQDTNHAQYTFVRMLAEKSGNLCVVGDDDQSIYRFRGATIENILSFEKQYPGCEVIKLEQNYRSTEIILTAANAVIRNNYQHKYTQLWSALGDGDQIKCCNFESEIAEARFVADTILDGVKEGKHYTDYALLYRSNSQSRSFENTLARSGIPYTIVGGLRFYDRKEIRDIMAYLAVINNPYDSVRFRRIINEPKRGIGDATVEEIIRISDGLHISPVEVCREASQFESLSRKSAALKAAANLFDELDELADSLRLDELIDAVAEKSGYIKSMQALGEEGSTRIENINELKSNALTMIQENEDTTLPDFLEQVALVSDLDSYDGDLDRVSLMTMHSAKGLEFDTVFLVGAEDNIFPSYRSINDPAEMEEERRLAYVAITRAKRMLYVTHTSYRVLYGQTMRNRLSTFIREIPEEYIEKTGDRPKQASTWKKPEKPNYLAQEAAKMVTKPTPVVSGIVFAPGDRVKHNVFGQGTVDEAKRMGNDTMLTISFDNGQVKKVMANFARIEKL